MRILIGIDTFGLIGGSERYALGVSEELARSGHEVGVICSAQSGAAPAGVRVVVEPHYSAERATRAELDQLARSVLAFRPEVLFLLSSRGRAAARRMTALKRHVPLVRYIQDHTLFCPGLNKMFVDGGVCTEGMGTVCLKRFYFHAGCTGFRREIQRRPFDALGAIVKWKRDIALAQRASSLAVASHYMQDELVKVGLAPERVALVPYFTRSASPAVPESPPDAATRRFVETPGAPLIFAPSAPSHTISVKVRAGATRLMMGPRA